MNKLRDLRHEKNKTQMEIAESAGVTQQNYSLIEKGIVTPSLKVAKKIADYFGSTVDDIFFDYEYNLNSDNGEQEGE